MEHRGRAQQLAAEALARGDHGGQWFESFYAGTGRDLDHVPWTDGEPHPRFLDWAQPAACEGAGRPALVVGCGTGQEAAWLAGHGWAVTAFDVSASAIAWARERHRDAGATFQVADLLDPPPQWMHAFALVVEIHTVQVLRDEPRARAIANIASFVAPGGRLFLLAHARAEDEDPGELPWPLTPAEVDSFLAHGLTAERREDLTDPGAGAQRRFRVVFRRPSGESAL